jgi:hypothetical protein
MSRVLKHAGRFPQLHGSNANAGYWGSAIADEMWDAHVAP